MRRRRRRRAGLPDQLVHVLGRVYDGATGARLTNYTAALQYASVNENASVSSDGLYYVGPLPSQNDFTIVLDAPGYRSFLSHNAYLPTYPDATTKQTGHVSYYYDAYLFPDSLQSPAATFTIVASDSSAPVAGSIRLTPMGSSVVDSSAADMPAGVADQVWSNDDDLQFRAVDKAFTGGTVSFAVGELVYGVKYEVLVTAADGLQPGTSTYQAGVDGSLSMVLNRLTVPGLAVAFENTSLGQLVADGELVIAFNEDIEFDPLESTSAMQKSIDEGLAIDSPDANDDGQRNTLKVVTGMITLGTSVTIDKNVLTLKWDPTSALATTDAADPILAVTYGDLDAIQLRPVGGQASDAATLSSLLSGSTSLTVPVAIAK